MSEITAEELNELIVEELNEIAKKLKIRGYSRMRKGVLIEKIMETQRPKLIFIDEPLPEINVQRPTPKPIKNITNQPQEVIPEINVPIFKPSKPKSKPKSKLKLFKHLASRAIKPINKKISKFVNFVLSYIPEPIKKNVNKRAKSLKENFKRIFNPTPTPPPPTTPTTTPPPTPPPPPTPHPTYIPKEIETALKGYLKTYRIDGQKGNDEKTFINKIKQKVIDLINQKKKKSIKVKFILTCKFIKKRLLKLWNDETSKYFNSPIEIIVEATDLSNLFDTMTNHLLGEFERFKENGYGWIFKHVEYFDIQINPWEPLSGSSYIPLPSKLASKKAIINVKNENDNECFKWSVTSAVFPKDKNPQRLNKQMRENSNNFDWLEIEFPVSLKDIDKFEKQNPQYKINVYGYEGEVYNLRISEKKLEAYIINLLLISNDETKHYCWIKNYSALMSNQVSKHKSKIYPCYRCHNIKYSKESLEKHKEYCNEKEAVKIIMPKDKDGNPMYIKFINYNRKMRVPFVYIC